MSHNVHKCTQTVNIPCLRKKRQLFTYIHKDLATFLDFAYLTKMKSKKKLLVKTSNLEKQLWRTYCRCAWGGGGILDLYCIALLYIAFVVIAIQCEIQCQKGNTWKAPKQKTGYGQFFHEKSSNGKLYLLVCIGKLAKQNYDKYTCSKASMLFKLV